MEWTGLNELREKFLSFFESKGHLRLPSYPLVPKDDKSLLLINSGMAPMKKFFTGEVTPPRKRVTTCQKCIRTPDIERVGLTARHGTFFEMLGNFSFGDYFKHDATAWAWEFFTKVLEMPEEKLYVSVYENDDEAYNIWTKEVGVSPDHMVHLGKEDNFWEHGTGPCGPCSEIYFDRGEDKGCGKPDCTVGCDCDRYVEVWNLVFTQFDSDGKGNYTPLEHPNIDTGMGLERLACVMQNVDNLFLVDTVQNIMKHVIDIAGTPYGKDEKTDISLRVITDHIRSTVFMIGDGVMPSNEGRGYVLRRLLRRAARHGRLLDVKRPFLYEVAQTVIRENESAYPELAQKKDFIIKLIKIEEENFSKTIEQGFNMLHDILSSNEIKELSGEDAFMLNDTYGFPIDLTKEILAEKGMTVNEERFRELLAEQKKRARAARKNAGADAWVSESIDLSDIPSTQFTGYTDVTAQAKLLAIVHEGERVGAVDEGKQVVLVFDKTPFYAESGGQTGDSGRAENAQAALTIRDTKKDHSGFFLHSAVIDRGTVSVGDTLTLQIDTNRRAAIRRNHTAAHLLQAALRKVLGTHVEQAGQLVTDDKLRFDFTHFSAMTANELLEVEDMVNREILKAVDVTVEEMPIEKAKERGAMALFGEKYGDVVRVVQAGNFSIELCGGTHVDNTSKIGLFKILSEGSVASGVRRIEAATGMGVIDTLNSYLGVIGEACQALKIGNPKELIRGCAQIYEDLKERDKIINDLNNKLAALKIDDMFANSELIKGVRIITAAFTDVSADMLKTMCDRALSMAPKSIVTIAAITDSKATFACACGKEAQQKGAHAGRIVKAVAQVAGGNGGGRPDMAMAGAKDVSKVDDALVAAKQIILDMVKE